MSVAVLAQRWRTRLPPMWSRFDSALSALGALTVLVLCYVVIAVIAVAPTDKTSFVYSYVQTRLKGQYNGK